MNPDQMTQAVVDALNEARQIAITRKHQAINISHLFKFLIQPGELVRQIFSTAGVDLKAMESEIDQEIDEISIVEGQNINYGESLSPNTMQLFQKAEQIQKDFNDDFMATDILAIALMDLNGEKLTSYLKTSGITEQQVKNAVSQIRSGERVTSKNQEDNYKALEKYGTDLVKAMRSGKMDPIIGRDEEILSVIRILSRKTKNNPILIGEPGVGKTAIIEGLAQRIVKGDVPENLKGKTIFSLDMGSLNCRCQVSWRIWRTSKISAERS